MYKNKISNLSLIRLVLFDNPNRENYKIVLTILRSLRLYERIKK